MAGDPRFGVVWSPPLCCFCVAGVGLAASDVLTRPPLYLDSMLSIVSSQHADKNFLLRYPVQAIELDDDLEEESEEKKNGDDDDGVRRRRRLQLKRRELQLRVMRFPRKLPLALLTSPISTS